MLFTLCLENDGLPAVNSNKSLRKRCYAVSGLKRLKRLIEKLLYANLACIYDLVSRSVSKGRWYEWQSLVINYFKGMTVLDVGCGTGNLLSTGRQAGFFMVGIDSSEYMIDAYKKKMLGSHFDKNIALADASMMPFLPGSFDTVVVTFPTDFIVNSEALSEVYRVLKMGGRLLILDGPNFRRGRDKYFFNALLNFLGDRSIKDVVTALESQQFRTMVSEVSSGIVCMKLIIANKQKAFMCHENEMIGARKQ